jgi:hypothetical protein
MPGTFRYPFGDPETTGFFGGYRPPSVASDDATAVPVGETTPASSPAATDVLTYPNGKPVMDFNTGQPFPRPDRLDMQNNIAAGGLIKQAVEAPGGGDVPNPDLMFAPLFVHGSVMDYQRPLGHPFGPFDKKKTNISAYNFGVVGGAAGYDLDRLLKGAGSYNLWRGNPDNAETSYGLSQERALSIKQGYDDYKAGRWSRSDADEPLSTSEP